MFTLFIVTNLHLFQLLVLFDMSPQVVAALSITELVFILSLLCLEGAIEGGLPLP